MVRMIVDGKLTNAPQDYALAWAIGNMVTTYDLVGDLHWAISFGMPASSSTRLIALLENVCESLNENAPIIDEPTLRRIVERLVPAFRIFVDATNSTFYWQKENVSADTRRKHYRELKETGPQVPEWFRTEEGVDQLENLTSSYGGYLDALEPSLHDLMDLVNRFDPDNYATQLQQTRERFPFARDVVTSGYVEAFRRAGGLQGE